LGAALHYQRSEDNYMGYFGSIVFLHPRFLLINASALLIITFVSVYITKAILGLNKADINGSLVALTFIAWAINFTALALALIITDVITYSIPYFNVVHAEFKSISRNNYLPEIIYTASVALLHAALLFSTYPAFRKKINDNAKRNDMFAAFVTSSPLVWAIIMCLELRIF